MDFAIELRNGGLCLYFLKNGRKIGDVNFTWEQAEWLYKQIGQLVNDFKTMEGGENERKRKNSI